MFPEIPRANFLIASGWSPVGENLLFNSNDGIIYNMISFIEGKIEFLSEKYLVLNVGGMGYKIFISPETSQKISEKGNIVKLWTHLEVREDAMELFGFLQMGELSLFETLLSVSGVGPRTALGILGVGSIDNLRRAIGAGDSSYLTRVSGIGKKTSERIIVELKDKMAGKGVLVNAPELREEVDALEALISLGYSQSEARDALQKTSSEKKAEERVREALKNLAAGK